MKLKITAIIITAFAVYLIGNQRVALWDRDEPRNAQAAREMWRTGDWVVPRLMGQVRTAKPVFTYWCQAIAMSALGDNAFAARLPSAVAMALTLIVLAAAIYRFIGAARSMWTILILSTSALVIAWSARSSLTDAVLLLWVTIAQLCLYAIWRGRGTWIVVIILAAAIGLAGLTKGPVVLGVLGTTLAMLLILSWFCRPLRTPAGTMPARPISLIIVIAKFLLAIAIIAAVVGPWMHLVEKRSPGFIWSSLSRNVIERTLEPLEQHKGPPGYYFITLWGTYFPWSLFLPVTIWLAFRHRNLPAIRFAIAACVGPWIMFELVRTKLPHYLLPAFPPLAFLTADALVRCFRGQYDDLVRRGFIAAAGAWAIIVIGIGILPWLALRAFEPIPLLATTAVTAVAVVYALAVFVRFQLRLPRAGALAMGAGMMLAMVIIFGWYLPQAWFLQLSPRLATILIDHGAGAENTQSGDVQMIQYKEPSLAFYQGGTIREQPENNFLLTHPVEDWPRWLVIREDVWNQMPARVKSNLELVGAQRGLDLADRGRVWTVYVLRKTRG
jgi:4-amino-4-deoxy-L-arabinose transferase-like glycosyltransferase